MAWCDHGDDNDLDDNYLDWSDDENFHCHSKYVVSSSSDEDEGRFLERLKSSRLVKKAKQDSKDDFEREMSSELSMTMQKLTDSLCQTSTTTTTASATVSDKTNETKSLEKPPEFYDDIYFDSDDSDGGIPEVQHKSPDHNKSGVTVGKKNKRRILSNDELFYDPHMDDRNQAWMDKMRRSYQVCSNKRSGTSQAKQKPLPESDAVLNCPACLTMLCMDCQRHEIYHNQYRAMFVFNCVVNRSEVLKFQKKNQKKKEYFKNKKKFKVQNSNADILSPEDLNLGKEILIQKNLEVSNQVQGESSNYSKNDNSLSKDDCSSNGQLPNKTEVADQAWKEHVTLVVCGISADQMIRPGFPTSLEKLFYDSFHCNQVPEVKNYLEKVLLIIDDAPGYTKSLVAIDSHRPDAKIVTTLNNKHSTPTPRET
ncbi:hypothetical protein SK128_008835 [Halocaridina rubra]|uniref:Uncharacterized protein n=1 Tax=Halocaridina rubra TaxID=373956 RepID=A0AAN9FUT6_HALRR